MKSSEFKKYLEKLGARFEKPKGGSHFKVYLNGQQTVFPYHGSKEIGKGLEIKIKKQLKIRD